MSNTALLQKANLRKFMKEVLKNLAPEDKQQQSQVITDHLLSRHQRFKEAQHIALYVSMKHEEVDTIPLIETVLGNPQKYANKHLYVPHIEVNKKSTNIPEMCFFELKSLEDYHTNMNDNNKFKLKQFNNPELMEKANVELFDLIIVPGLAFDNGNQIGKISRLGRGKGYYDVFLSKIPSCYTLGIGFNEQFLSFNEELRDKQMSLPMTEGQDVQICEYLCEQIILADKTM